MIPFVVLAFIDDLRQVEVPRTILEVVYSRKELLEVLADSRYHFTEQRLVDMLEKGDRLLPALSNEPRATIAGPVAHFLEQAAHFFAEYLSRVKNDGSGEFPFLWPRPAEVNFFETKLLYTFYFGDSSFFVQLLVKSDFI